MTGAVISAGSLAYPLICIRITLCLFLKPRARRVILNFFTGSPVKMAGFFMFMARLRNGHVNSLALSLPARRQIQLQVNRRAGIPARECPTDIHRLSSARVQGERNVWQLQD